MLHYLLVFFVIHSDGFGRTCTELCLTKTTDVLSTLFVSFIYPEIFLLWDARMVSDNQTMNIMAPVGECTGFHWQLHCARLPLDIA